MDILSWGHRGTNKGISSTRTETAFEISSFSFLWLWYTSVLKGTVLGREGGLWPQDLHLSNWAVKGCPMLLLGCYLDICQVGNASKDLRSPSLSRRTATEMAFHELNYVLGFKANMGQKMFPSQEVLSQRSEGVPGNDGAQLPSQGTSPTTSVTTEL